MANSLLDISRKNLNLAVGLFSLLVFLWVIMFAIPSLFVTLFDTILGNLILIIIIVMAGLYNKGLSFGLFVIFMILWRFSHMSSSSAFII